MKLEQYEKDTLLSTIDICSRALADGIWTDDDDDNNTFTDKITMLRNR